MIAQDRAERVDVIREVLLEDLREFAIRMPGQYICLIALGEHLPRPLDCKELASALWQLEQGAVEYAPERGWRLASRRRAG